MPPKSLKVEPLSPDYWERIPPPVDQELWKRYMNEDDSDSDCSDSEAEEEGSMAGPSSASKTTKPEAPEARPKSKNDLIKDVLDDSFNDTIYGILNGGPTGEAASAIDSQKEAKTEPEKPKDSQESEQTRRKDSNSAPNESKPSNPSSKTTVKAERGNTNPADLSVCPNCSLPRLKHPRIGLNSRPPPDSNASYCANEPPVVLAGHDVHGNAFPGFKPKPNTFAGNTNNTNTTSFSTSLAAGAAASKPTKAKPNTSKSDKRTAAAAADTSSPTNSQDSSDENKNNSSYTNAATPSASASSSSLLPLEYPTIKTPQMKCPNNCGQWKTVNVMAKHLDACLLGKGRKAGREARERIGASGSANNNGAGTPVGEGSISRAGTPKPGAGAGAGGAAGGGVKRGRVEDGDAAMAKSGKKQKKGK